MPWVKFDDQTWSNPKIVSAGNEAVGAWLRMVCHCNAHLTDGKVSGPVAIMICGGSRELLDTMIAARLLSIDGENYIIDDYLEYQPSRRSVEKKRREINARVTRYRTRVKRVSNAAPDPDPDPDPKTDQKVPCASPKRGFDLGAIYDLYPRKKGKTAGLKRLKSSIKTQADYDAALVAVKNHAAQMAAERRELDKIPYFSTWTSTWRDDLEPGADSPLFMNLPNDPKRQQQEENRRAFNAKLKADFEAQFPEGGK